MQACHEVRHTWRERELGPAESVWAFWLQVLHGNTACLHVVRLAQLTCSGAASCKARARLPLAALQRILEQTCQAAQHTNPTRQPNLYASRALQGYRALPRGTAREESA